MIGAMALCPGLIDTDASRPWFEDMSAASAGAITVIPRSTGRL